VPGLGAGHHHDRRHDDNDAVAVTRKGDFRGRGDGLPRPRRLS
jgi:hypothetical protein